MDQLPFVEKHKLSDRLFLLYKLPGPANGNLGVNVLRQFSTRPALAFLAIRVRDHFIFLDEVYDAFLRYIYPRRVHEIHTERFQIDLRIAADEVLSYLVELLAFLEQL